MVPSCSNASDRTAAPTSSGSPIGPMPGCPETATTARTRGPARTENAISAPSDRPTTPTPSLRASGDCVATSLSARRVVSVECRAREPHRFAGIRDRAPLVVVQRRRHRLLVGIVERGGAGMTATGVVDPGVIANAARAMPHSMTMPLATGISSDHRDSLYPVADQPDDLRRLVRRRGNSRRAVVRRVAGPSK